MNIMFPHASNYYVNHKLNAYVCGLHSDQHGFIRMSMYLISMCLYRSQGVQQMGLVATKTAPKFCFKNIGKFQSFAEIPFERKKLIQPVNKIMISWHLSQLCPHLTQGVHRSFCSSDIVAETDHQFGIIIVRLLFRIVTH